VADLPYVRPSAVRQTYEAAQQAQEAEPQIDEANPQLTPEDLFSFAVSAPTPAKREARLSRVSSMFGRDSALNYMRRLWLSSAFRRLHVLARKYPEVAAIRDQVFPSPELRGQGQTMTEARTLRLQEHFGPVSRALEAA